MSNYDFQINSRPEIKPREPEWQLWYSGASLAIAEMYRLASLNAWSDLKSFIEKHARIIHCRQRALESMPYMVVEDNAEIIQPGPSQ